MADSKQQNSGLIIVAIALVTGAVYFIYKQLNPKKSTDEEDKNEVPPGNTSGQQDTSANAKADTGGGAASQVAPPSSPSNAAKPTADQVALATAYRVWANSTDALSKKYGKLSKYDLDEVSATPYNSYFLKSYEAGKTEYEASLKGGTTPGIITDELKAAINNIVANGTGEKAQRSYLNNVARKNPDYPLKWSEALNGGITYFIFANQVYSADRGVRILDYNPFKVPVWYSTGGQIAKLNPTADSSASYVTKGISVGKMRGMVYKSSPVADKGLWGYFPDNGGMYKWTKLNWVSRVKP